MLIEISDLTKVYDTGKVQVNALRGVDLNIDDGEFVAIMGPSGSGKTTFMNVLGCLDRPTAGRYAFEGRAINSLTDSELADLRNKRMGFVFQNYSLLQQATALHNVELPLLYGRVPNRRRRALEALERLGVGERAHHKPMELSGGQQQRVAIARAIVNEPPIILADEPTGNLDSKTGEEVMGLFCDLNAQGITIVIVTHDDNVAAYCSRLIEFLDGRIVNDNHGGGQCRAPRDDALEDTPAHGVAPTEAPREDGADDGASAEGEVTQQ